MNKKYKKIFVGGINGVGKSCIFSFIKNERPDLKIIKGSISFMKWLNIEEGDYNSLQKLDEKDARQKLGSFMKDITTKNERVIVDGHYINIINEIPIDWVDEWISGFDLLTMARARPEKIAKRIKEDKSRVRNNYSLQNEQRLIDKIDFFQKKSEEVMIKNAKKYKLPYLFINNDKNGPDNFKVILNLLEELDEIKN